MILKIVEGVSSKDTFHVAKIAVNLSIFSKLPFFKIAAKVKKAQQTHYTGAKSKITQKLLTQNE